MSDDFFVGDDFGEPDYEGGCFSIVLSILFVVIIAAVCILSIVVMNANSL